MGLSEDAALWPQDDGEVDEGCEHEAVQEEQGLDNGQQQPASRGCQSHACDMYVYTVLQLLWTAVHCLTQHWTPDKALDLSHTQASGPTAPSSQEAQQCCKSTLMAHQGLLNQKALGANLCTTPPAGMGRHTRPGITA